MSEKRNHLKEILPKGKKMMISVTDFPGIRLLKVVRKNNPPGCMSLKFKNKYKKATWGNFDKKNIIIIGCVTHQLLDGFTAVQDYKVRFESDSNTTHFMCSPLFLKFPRK